MMDLGEQITCMVMVFIYGKMEEDMKVIMSMTKNMDLEFMFGQMVENMKVIGQMANRMDKGNIFYLME